MTQRLGEAIWGRLIDFDIRVNEFFGGTRGATISQDIRDAERPLLHLIPHFAPREKR